MRILTLLGLLAVVSFASACNTMKGAGEDLQRGGENLERSAEKHGAQP